MSQDHVSESLRGSDHTRTPPGVVPDVIVPVIPGEPDESPARANIPVFVGGMPSSELLGDGEEPTDSRLEQVWRTTKHVSGELAKRVTQTSLGIEPDGELSEPLVGIQVEAYDDRYMPDGSAPESVGLGPDQHTDPSDGGFVVTDEQIFDAYKSLAEEFLPQKIFTGGQITIAILATIASGIANYYYLDLSGDFAVQLGTKFGLEGDDLEYFRQVFATDAYIMNIPIGSRSINLSKDKILDEIRRIARLVKSKKDPESEVVLPDEPTILKIVGVCVFLSVIGVVPIFFLVKGTMEKHNVASWKAVIEEVLNILVGLSLNLRSSLNLVDLDSNKREAAQKWKKVTLYQMIGLLRDPNYKTPLTSDVELLCRGQLMEEKGKILRNVIGITLALGAGPYAGAFAVLVATKFESKNEGASAELYNILMYGMAGIAGLFRWSLLGKALYGVTQKVASNFDRNLFKFGDEVIEVAGLGNNKLLYGLAAVATVFGAASMLSPSGVVKNNYFPSSSSWGALLGSLGIASLGAGGINPDDFYTVLKSLFLFGSNFSAPYRRGYDVVHHYGATHDQFMVRLVYAVTNYPYIDFVRKYCRYFNSATQQNLGDLPLNETDRTAIEQMQQGDIFGYGVTASEHMITNVLERLRILQHAQPKHYQIFLEWARGQHEERLRNSGVMKLFCRRRLEEELLDPIPDEDHVEMTSIRVGDSVVDYDDSGNAPGYSGGATERTPLLSGPPPSSMRRHPGFVASGLGRTTYQGGALPNEVPDDMPAPPPTGSINRGDVVLEMGASENQGIRGVYSWE